MDRSKQSFSKPEVQELQNPYILVVDFRKLYKPLNLAAAQFLKSLFQAPDVEHFAGELAVTCMDPSKFLGERTNE